MESMSARSTIRRWRFGAPIIVVSGLPRSGTSMAMRMLASGGVPVVADGHRSADEDNPRGYFEDQRVTNLEKDLDRQWVREARGKTIKIISWLLEYLPESNNYHVLFMNRDLDEVLKSQATMLARRGESSGVEDERMRANLEQHVRQAKALLRARPGCEVCDLDYRAVLQEPRVASERIQGFLGRRLDLERMAAAVDPSLYRNRASGTGAEGAPA
jgi:hypothetical protein